MSIDLAMTTPHIQTHHEHHHDTDSMDVFGFWLYILSDCILFGSIFAVFAVLHHNIASGPSIKDFVDAPYVLAETLALLASSFTFGLAILALYKKQTTRILQWLFITFILGGVFIGLEINEFVHLYVEGHTWQTSAALSAFFTLVGTHGLHVTIGLLWMAVMMVQLLVFKASPEMERRLTYLGLFWAFLDVIWIFVFTIVYLMGAV